MYKKAVFTAYQVGGSFTKRYVLPAGISVQTDGLKIVMHYKLTIFSQKREVKTREFPQEVKGVFEGVTSLVFACPSYIVKRVFSEEPPFLNFFVPVSSRRKIFQSVINSRVLCCSVYMRAFYDS